MSEINRRGTTVLMVTHEHSLVKHFHKRIIQIHSGEIVADTAAMQETYAPPERYDEPQEPEDDDYVEYDNEEPYEPEEQETEAAQAEAPVTPVTYEEDYDEDDYEAASAVDDITREILMENALQEPEDEEVD